MALVLCTGADPVLLETRKLILELAGHTVISATNQNEVIDACKWRTFDVAVIGQSVSLNSKRVLASLVRQHCPLAKILELHTANQSRTVEDADSWLEVPADVPQELAERVDELAGKSRKRMSA